MNLFRFRMLTLLGPLLFHGLGVRAQTTAPERVLVAYFSHSGHTRALADEIREATGADLFEIVPVESYPDAYPSVVDRAKREIEADYRPALKTTVEDMARFDVVFVGSPCWWGTIAPPVAAFLAAYDFTGKTVVPFMTHGGSGMGHSEADIRRICPKATLREGLPVRGNRVDSAGAAVSEWLRKSGMQSVRP